MNCSSNADREDIYIVIFLADFDTEWIKNMSRTLHNLYPKLIISGTMHIIHAPYEFYPSLANLTHTYNDPEQKRKWRSKQNVDYSFLFMYSEPLSSYYMQLEDDVYTIPRFIPSIRKTITAKTNWVCLEFSELGFIGKTFHNHHLRKLAEMTMLFYEQQPVDFTYLYFNIQMLQFQRNIVRPSLFQHVGIQSSLVGKIQPLKDKFFDYIAKTYKGDNPPADVFTTFTTHSQFPPFSAYSLDDGYFWSKKEPKKDDTFTIVFHTPVSLERIVIDTGSKEHPTDKLLSAKLDASMTLINKTEKSAHCTNDIHLGDFVDGFIDVKDMGSKMGPFKMQCLRITVTENHQFWVIVREIAVFTTKS